MPKSAHLASLSLLPILLGSQLLPAQCGLVPPSLTPIGSGSNQVFTVALPFAFPFQGQAFSSITISTNGFVWLGTPGNGARCCHGNGALFASDPPSIAILWTELVAGGVYYEADAFGNAIVTWQAVHEAGATAVFDLQMTLAATGQINFWYGPGTAVASHQALAGVSAGNNATSAAIAYWTDLPYSSACGTVYQQFAPTQTNLAGQGIVFIPSGPATWVVLDGGCSPWPGPCATFVFDRSATMANIRTGTSITRAVDSVDFASADVDYLFGLQPNLRVLLFECHGGVVTRIGNVYTDPASAKSAMQTLPAASGNKPLAEAICTAVAALVALNPAAPVADRTLLIYSDDSADASPPSSCRASLPDSVDGDSCAQTVFQGPQGAFDAGSWQQAVCSVVAASVGVDVYYFSMFTDTVGNDAFFAALCELTGGSYTGIPDASTMPRSNPWRSSGSGCTDHLGTTLRMVRTGIPQIGATVEIGCRTGSGMPFLLGVGFSDHQAGATVLPYDLGPLGAPGCAVRTSWDVTEGVFAYGAVKSLALPNTMALAGLQLYWQGAEFAPANNALGLATSDLLSMLLVP